MNRLLKIIKKGEKELANKFFSEKSYSLDGCLREVRYFKDGILPNDIKSFQKQQTLKLLEGVNGSLEPIISKLAKILVTANWEVENSMTLEAINNEVKKLSLLISDTINQIKK